MRVYTANDKALIQKISGLQNQTIEDKLQKIEPIIKEAERYLKENEILIIKDMNIKSKIYIFEYKDILKLLENDYKNQSNIIDFVLLNQLDQSSINTLFNSDLGILFLTERIISLENLKGLVPYFVGTLFNSHVGYYILEKNIYNLDQLIQLSIEDNQVLLNSACSDHLKTLLSKKLDIQNVISILKRFPSLSIDSQGPIKSKLDIILEAENGIDFLLNQNENVLSSISLDKLKIIINDLNSSNKENIYSSFLIEEKTEELANSMVKPDSCCNIN